MGSQVKWPHSNEMVLTCSKWVPEPGPHDVERHHPLAQLCTSFVVGKFHPAYSSLAVKFQPINFECYSRLKLPIWNFWDGFHRRRNTYMSQQVLGILLKVDTLPQVFSRRITIKKLYRWKSAKLLSNWLQFKRIDSFWDGGKFFGAYFSIIIESFQKYCIERLKWSSS